jgi:predicted nucleic acid-binding protein
LVDLARIAEVDLIVSGDRDLHDALGDYFDVVAPREFLAELDRGR